MSGAGSIRINPWDVIETSKAILYALEMSPAERKVGHCLDSLVQWRVLTVTFALPRSTTVTL